MPQPPSPDSGRSGAASTAPRGIAALSAFSTDLAGTLRSPSVIATLAQHLKASFRPAGLAIALADPDSGQLRILHHDGADPEELRPLLEAALRDGVTPVTNRLGVAIASKRGIGGAIALAGGVTPFTTEDLGLLQAFASITALALESTHLVEAFDDSKRSWEDTVDAVSMALCIVDRNGRIQRANRAFAALIGAPITGIAGRPWLELIPPGWAGGVMTALETAGVGPEIELRTSERCFAVTGYPISASERGSLVLLFEDQTERRRLQDQLIQSEKMSAIGQLIAGVAHDLNNPLTSVVGFADFLAETEDTPAKLREPLRVIQQEAERAANIVRNLLSFARKQEHRRGSTAVRPLLNATLGLLHNQLMTNHVEARLEVEPDLPELDIDANQIQQVFVNLINNAAQAIASAGRPGAILIRARKWIDGVAVDVIDDGPGISPELAAKVFEPFFTTKPEGQGTGLGLSISQGIVKEHGGRIALTSAENAGATFTVELPRRSRPAPAPLPEAVQAAPHPLRVLVVDDEPHILHYMRATLEAWGHSVDVAADGHIGLERAAQGDFDLIISDLRMPRLGGREFYEELQRRAPPLARRMVFSTGDTIRGDTLSFLEQQGRPCLHKPFSLAELRTLLGNVSRQGQVGTPVRASE